MDPGILAASIGAGGAILAALITAAARRRAPAFSERVIVVERPRAEAPPPKPRRAGGRVAAVLLGALLAAGAMMAYHQGRLAGTWQDAQGTPHRIAFQKSSWTISSPLPGGGELIGSGRFDGRTFQYTLPRHGQSADSAPGSGSLTLSADGKVLEGELRWPNGEVHSLRLTRVAR